MTWNMVISIYLVFVVLLVALLYRTGATKPLQSEWENQQELDAIRDANAGQEDREFGPIEIIIRIVILCIVLFVAVLWVRNLWEFITGGIIG